MKIILDPLCERVRTHLLESSAVKLQVAELCMPSILAAANLITNTFRRGSKVMLCGNGGSAADSQHMAAEFVCRLSKEFERPALPAISLTVDTSFITAFANDYGIAGIFARQVEALGNTGDVLVAISTSGNSENIIRAVQVANTKQIKTIGLLGEGGQLSQLVDCPIVIPSRNTQIIQESLLSVEHILCDIVERLVFDPKFLSEVTTPCQSKSVEFVKVPV